MQSTINDDNDVIYDYDLTITLPHDNLFSPCFFESFSNAVPAGIDYLRLGRSRHLIRECTRELEDILEKKVRVRLVPTFGMKVASFVDKSKHVCFDFDSVSELNLEMDVVVEFDVMFELEFVSVFGLGFFVEDVFASEFDVVSESVSLLWFR